MSKGVNTGGRAEVILIFMAVRGVLCAGVKIPGEWWMRLPLSPMEVALDHAIWSKGLMVLRVRRKLTRFPTSILLTPVDSIHSILYIVWCYELRPWA